MADATIKPDSGNDLVLSNDDGSAKIEVNENGTVAVTGTVSGITASEVGLGNVANESKATMFTSPTLTGTPNLGSNPTVTLGSNATFPDGHFIKDPVSAAYTGTTITVTSGNSDIISATISADSTDDKILIIAHITYRVDGNSSVTNGYNYLRILDQTNGDTELCRAMVQYEASANNLAQGGVATFCHIVSPSTTGDNTYMLNGVYGAGRMVVRGNGDSAFVNPTEITLFYIKS